MIDNSSNLVEVQFGKKYEEEQPHSGSDLARRQETGHFNDA